MVDYESLRGWTIESIIPFLFLLFFGMFLPNEFPLAVISDDEVVCKSGGARSAM